MIRIYTSPTCPNCMLLKDILDEHGYEYEEKYITDDDVDTNELSCDSNCNGVPILQKENKYFCGFNEQDILDFLM